MCGRLGHSERFSPAQLEPVNMRTGASKFRAGSGQGGYLLSHPAYNVNTLQTALALDEARLLKEFWTTLSAPSVLRLLPLPAGVAARVSRRQAPALSAGVVRTHARYELARVAMRMLGIAKAGSSEWVDAVVRNFDAHVSRRLRQEIFEGVYAYEDCADQSFSVARERGSRTVYELPIGYWKQLRQVAGEEARAVPEYAGTFRTGPEEGAGKLARKDRELEKADVVIVPSRFVAASLPREVWPRVVRVPYGAPPPIMEAALAYNYDRPLRALYVGALTQRKGLSYLIDAFHRLSGKCELTLVGRVVGSSAALARELARHRWFPTASRQDVLRLMREHDVFVFPTLFEGRALVNLEALSQGLPIITTESSGIDETLQDGVNGIRIPERSSQAIREAIEKLSDDRELLARMKREALRSAGACSWARYREELLRALTTTAPAVTSINEVSGGA